MEGGNVPSGLVLWGLETQIKIQDSAAIGIRDAGEPLYSCLNLYLYCCRFCICLMWILAKCNFALTFPVFSHFLCSYLMLFTLPCLHYRCLFGLSSSLQPLFFSFYPVKFNSVFPYLKISFASYPQLLKLRSFKIPKPEILQKTELKLQILCLAIHLLKLVRDNI